MIKSNVSSVAKKKNSNLVLIISIQIQKLHEKIFMSDYWNI